MNCSHEKVKFTPTPQLTHHGREDCELCGRFVRWVPKPETLERQQRNGSRIVALRNDPRLSEWEKGFIATLDGQGPKLSPRQQDKLDAIFSKYVR